MKQKLSFTIYTSSAQLPEDWDTVAQPNIFLSRACLTVFETAAPANMECHFIGLFADRILCGVAISQYIDLSKINTFAEKQKKHRLKEYLFKQFTKHILIIGNNTLTGQNAYVHNAKIEEHDALLLLKEAFYTLKKQYRQKGTRINMLAVKDFNRTELPDFNAAGFRGYFRFSTQPNMIFSSKENWKSLKDYVSSMNTKYRTQYNRARRKGDGIEKKQLNKEDINAHEDKIRSLYLTVAGNASFNTFYLPKEHFYILKEQLADNFIFYGYFLKNRLVGFNTLIKNGNDIDTYFLGYDASVQKEKMLYLNMLYDIAGYAIENHFTRVIFARSAMEIKSSIGAKAEAVYGIIKHTNPILNLFMGNLFNYFEPKIEWKERSPFKD